MKFNDRLKDFREKLGIETKREMADKVGISEQLYSMLEVGSRNPSKKVLKNLVELSGLPEEYWVYGVINDKSISEREVLKDTKESINLLINLGIIKDENLSKEAMEVLTAALKADIKHLLLKKKHN
ncbi:MAG: helix-turn-helix transcriptional regulator [Clostridium sp.]|uniref:helix-turn-helix transcriptional regulator n=1 Tax=Clostridium TaxID=1485 RepID=UPI002905348E|nr:helix-turn-helix transcriptional regulator [Clostridium sp.]MDU2156536.1 helix-turn-helix transcriptional regulator [Clostridium sp.]MDU7085893.1 helix-turn-helix transcriptional regulator [Clostridium sp.]